MKRVLRYLSGTLDLKLQLGGSDELTLEAFSDADFAGSRISSTRKSTSGYVVKLFGGVISWQSKKQSVTALSTMEAEYISACSAVKEISWLKKLCRDLGLNIGRVPLFCDNQCAVSLVKNPGNHPKAKHIDTQFHFIREEHLKGSVEIKWTSGKDLIADVMTKPLPEATFKLNLTPSSRSEAEGDC